MATNRADTLDPALLRPGRLDRKIEFPLPDRRQKRLIFSTITGKMNLSDEVDLEDCIQLDHCVALTMCACTHTHTHRHTHHTPHTHTQLCPLILSHHQMWLDLRKSPEQTSMPFVRRLANGARGWVGG